MTLLRQLMYRNTLRISVRMVVAMLAVLPARAAWSVDARASREVREGIQQHQAGDYSAASQSFSKAAEILPEDPRIAFNQGCALAAQGKAEDAALRFETATLAEDATLRANAHYNLGRLRSAEAKQLFGEQPAEATPETRLQGIKTLEEAVRHYRNCLKTDPGNKAARHNLELLRLWIKHMQELWAERDRQQQREELDLLQFLEMIWNEERRMQQLTEALAAVDDSPRRRQAVRELEQQQRQLSEEIPYLISKIESSLRNDAGPAGQTQQAIETLSQMAFQARSAMLRAADDLAVGSLPSSLLAQQEAGEALDQLYRALAPFQALLQRSMEYQERLVETSRVATELEASSEQVSDRETKDQAFVHGWSTMFVPRAEQESQQLSAQQSPAGQDNRNAEEQQAALQQMYEKAIELGPEIVEKTQAAEEALRGGRHEDALPNQERALELMQEIARTVPPDPKEQDEQSENQQDENQQDENQQDENQQDENQQDENQQDENQGQDQDQEDGSDKDQDQEDGSDKNQDQEEEKQGEEKQQDRDRPQESEAKQPPPKLPPRQVETILNKVRQREREHRERTRQLQQILRGSIPVERDW